MASDSTLLSTSSRELAPVAAYRPAVALINNAPTPYRIAMHCNLVARLPQIKIYSVFTHDQSNAPWSLTVPPEINPVFFGPGESTADQGKPSRSLQEYRKGGRIIQWMKDTDIRFAVVAGYSDAGRLRILRWCNRTGVPCFIFGDSNIRGDHASGIKALVKHALISRVTRWATGALVCGRMGRDYFVKYGADPASVFLFPFQPDYKAIEAVTADDLAQVRERFKMPAGRRTIIYSGRLSPEKRVDLLIDAFAAVAPNYPEWNLLIVGDGPLRQALEARVPPALKQRVIWTGFINDPSVVSSLYRLSDVLVLPSDFEPWALVISEAVAAGLAVIASNTVGAAPELIRESINGRIFTAGSLANLTECLRDVLAPGRVEEMKGASADVLADWRRHADPATGLLQALAAAKVLPVSI